MGDSGDGLMLCPVSSCPAGTRNASNVVPALLEQGDGSAEGDSRGSPGDSKTALGDGTEEEYSVVYGKRYPIVRCSLDDIIHRSAAKIMAQIYKQKGILVPEFSFAPQRPVCPPISPSGE